MGHIGPYIDGRRGKIEGQGLVVERGSDSVQHRKVQGR